MGLKDAWQRIRMIWSFAVGALIGGAGVAAFFSWFAAHPLNPRTPAQVMVAPVRSPGPLPGAGPPPGWHFVPNGVEGCADKYGCARPSFDSDFWEWVASGEQDCADEHGCARPRLKVLVIRERGLGVVGIFISYELQRCLFGECIARTIGLEQAPNARNLEHPRAL
jgi:hypothetical protein